VLTQLATCGEDTIHRVGHGQLGVDVVYDLVGMIEMSPKCVTYNARLLVIGFAAKGRIEPSAANECQSGWHELGPISKDRCCCMERDL
jgi:hypothetical protein